MTKFGAVSILYPTLVLFRTFPMGDIKTNLLKRFAEFPRFFSNFFPEFSDIIFNRDDGFFFFSILLSLIPSKPFREMRHVQRPFVVFSCHAREFGSFFIFRGKSVYLD